MAKVTLRVSSPKTGEPPIGGGSMEEKVLVTKNKPQVDQNFDLRDRLAELVGKGNALNPDDRAAIYGNLVNLLGKDKAQKVFQHAYIFNSRPDIQKLPLEDKLKSFYTIGSNDADVMEVLGRTKNLGYGVLPGFRNSFSQINQQLTGQIPVTESVQVPEEMQRKVALKIRK